MKQSQREEIKEMTRLLKKLVGNLEKQETATEQAAAAPKSADFEADPILNVVQIAETLGKNYPTLYHRLKRGLEAGAITPVDYLAGVKCGPRYRLSEAKALLSNFDKAPSVLIDDGKLNPTGLYSTAALAQLFGIHWYRVEAKLDEAVKAGKVTVSRSKKGWPRYKLAEVTPFLSGVS